MFLLNCGSLIYLLRQRHSTAWECEISMNLLFPRQTVRLPTQVEMQGVGSVIINSWTTRFFSTCLPEAPFNPLFHG